MREKKRRAKKKTNENCRFENIFMLGIIVQGFEIFFPVYFKEKIIKEKTYCLNNQIIIKCINLIPLILIN
jgi:hypothetical protein